VRLFKISFRTALCQFGSWKAIVTPTVILSAEDLEEAQKKAEAGLQLFLQTSQDQKP
jgi:hypothetical protein